MVAVTYLHAGSETEREIGGGLRDSTVSPRGDGCANRRKERKRIDRRKQGRKEKISIQMQ